jgi:hypothetical protein
MVYNQGTKAKQDLSAQPLFSSIRLIQVEKPIQLHLSPFFLTRPHSYTPLLILMRLIGVSSVRYRTKAELYFIAPDPRASGGSGPSLISIFRRFRNAI